MIKQGEDAEEFHLFPSKWFRIERFSSPIHEAEIKGLSYPLFLYEAALRSCSPLPLSLVPSLTHNGNEMRPGRLMLLFQMINATNLYFPWRTPFSYSFSLGRLAPRPPSAIQSCISFPDIICTAYRAPKGQAFLSNPKHTANTNGHFQQWKPPCSIQLKRPHRNRILF